MITDNQVTKAQGPLQKWILGIFVKVHFKKESLAHGVVSPFYFTSIYGAL